jgi:hypothetical protein
MNTHLENFENWFAGTLESLYQSYEKDRHSGFIIVLVAFPLLERYLRQKAGLTPQNDLSDKFYNEMLKMFPMLSSQQKAKDFWSIYRNGLLHQVTFSDKTKKGDPLAYGRLSHAKSDAIFFHVDDSSCIHPVLFAKQVIEEIRNNFPIFVGVSSAAPRLPTVKTIPDSYGNYYSGTSSS